MIIFENITNHFISFFPQQEVTRVRGIEVYGLDPEILCKEWQKKFACSVSVSLVPGMTKEKEIVMQVL